MPIVTETIIVLQCDDCLQPESDTLVVSYWETVEGPVSFKDAHLCAACAGARLAQFVDTAKTRRKKRFADWNEPVPTEETIPWP